jgi:hypothetical protein
MKSGAISQSFRVAAAVLAAIAVLLAFLLTGQDVTASPVAWVMAAAAAGAVYLLAEWLLAMIMVALAPVLIVAVVVRYLAS